MSEEEKEGRGRSKGAPKGEAPEEKAAGSPGSSPMGSGDPDAGKSGSMGTGDARGAGEEGPMGTGGTETNEDAASRDGRDEGEG